MYFPPLANDYMVRYTFLTRVFSWDLIISFLFHSSSNFHNILMIRSSFQLKDCSEKSNQILEITITYVKVKKRFQRKMWKIIIHFRYFMLMCVLKVHHLSNFLNIIFNVIKICAKYSFQFHCKV